MNNSVFGKMMENIRKHRVINLVTNEEAYLKRMMKPNFKSGMGCELEKIRVVMNKPVYIGQSILDLSKICMYKFHYNYIKPKYGANFFVCVRWTPTPWFVTSRLMISMKTLPVTLRFDTSGYSHSQVCPLPMGVNRNVIGLMKGKLGRRVMTRFVTLRLKLYT